MYTNNAILEKQIWNTLRSSLTHLLKTKKKTQNITMSGVKVNEIT